VHIIRVTVDGWLQGAGMSFASTSERLCVVLNREHPAVDDAALPASLDSQRPRVELRLDMALRRRISKSPPVAFATSMNYRFQNPNQSKISTQNTTQWYYDTHTVYSRQYRAFRPL
jgi:hypothetical protein